jgi:hypothetical protein
MEQRREIIFLFQRSKKWDICFRILKRTNYHYFPIVVRDYFPIILISCRWLWCHILITTLRDIFVGVELGRNS